MQARAIFEAALDVAKETGKAGRAGNHDPAGRHAPRARTHARPRREMAERCSGTQGAGRISRRHDDRTAARRPACRRDRGGSRVLLLRHQRSDADHAWHLARRRLAASSRPTRRRASTRRTRSSRSIAMASANWSASAARVAARTRPRLKLGVCGEHGGDPASIFFFEEVGLDYVLAAAHAALKKGR
jgi:hypothetical protein